MKTFIYQGFDGQGIRTRGMIEANDLKDARDKLSRSGVFPEEVNAATDSMQQSAMRSSKNSLNKTETRAEFYRAASTLLNAGLPLESALDLLLQQPAGSEHSGSDIAGIRDHIRDGGGLADSMTEARVSISAFESAVIESGERTGNMAAVLEQVAEYLEDVSRINRDLKTACVYPLVIIITACIVCTGVLGFLVPQMAVVFEGAGIELPAITRGVTWLGKYFLPLILPVLLLVTIAAAALYSRFVKEEAGKISVEQVLSRIPIIAKGFQLLVLARFSRTMALLLDGGISLIDAFGLAARATGSAWITKVSREKVESVRHGEAFHEAVASVPMIGPGLRSWAKAGEASGDLQGLLYHASERFQQLWSNYIRRLMSIVEPVLIVVVAVFVLLIALAILLPILSLNTQIV